MPTFYVTGISSHDVSMKIELSDEDVENSHPDNIVDTLMNKFNEERPGGICAHCSGWSQSWSRDVSDDFEYVITDDDHNIVYENDQLKGSFLEQDNEDEGSS